MTNIQNLGIIIINLMEEKQKIKKALDKAEDWNAACRNRVIIWEAAYIDGGKEEEVGQKLDEIYNEYSEANEAMHEAEEQVEAIEEALKALRKAAEAIEWLGL